MATYYHNAPIPQYSQGPRHLSRAWHLMASASSSSRSGLGAYLIVLLIACVPVVGWIFAQGVWYEYARKVAWGVDEGFHIPDEPFWKLCVTGLRVVALEFALYVFWCLLILLVRDGLFILVPFIPLLGMLSCSLTLSLSLRVTLARSMRDAVRVKPLFRMMSADKRYFAINLTAALMTFVVAIAVWLVCLLGLQLTSEAFRGFTVIHEAFLWGVTLLAVMACMTVWIVAQALWMRQFMESNQSDDLVCCSCGSEHHHSENCQSSGADTCLCNQHHKHPKMPQSEDAHAHDECTSQGQIPLKRDTYPAYRQPPKRD